MRKLTYGREIFLFDLFDFSRTIAAPLFSEKAYPWEALRSLQSFIYETGESLTDEYIRTGDIWIARDAVVAPTACISGPCIIDHGAEIRHGAFIRGSVIIGKNCVVGNSSEVKNSILFDGAQAPHFNYVGDSILGFKAHIGAGVITSNLKSDKTSVTVCGIDTGLRKLGALIGDHAEIGCGAVLCPGTMIGRNSTVYPLSMVRGCVPPGYIYKSAENIVVKREE